MINARGILLYVKEKEYYLPYDRFPWFKDAMDIDLELDSLVHPERYPITFA